jgi:hypothetical protein
MTNQVFYERVSSVSKQLCAIGLEKDGHAIDYLLYNIAWTSAEELFMELYSALTAFKDGGDFLRLPEQLQQEILECIQFLGYGQRSAKAKGDDSPAPQTK